MPIQSLLATKNRKNKCPTKSFPYGTFYVPVVDRILTVLSQDNSNFLKNYNPRAQEMFWKLKKKKRRDTWVTLMWIGFNCIPHYGARETGDLNTTSLRENNHHTPNQSINY